MPITVRKPWVTAVLAATVALLIAAHLVPWLPHNVMGSGVRNGLHIIAFGIAGLGIGLALRAPGEPIGFLRPVLIVLAAGIAAEALQAISGRRFDPTDVVRDVIGAVGFILAWRLAFPVSDSGAGHESPGLRRTAALCLVAAMLAPAVFWFAILNINAARFPVIASPGAFSGRVVIESRHSTIGFSASNAHDTPATVDVTLSDERPSGVLVGVAAQDWTRHGELVLDIDVAGSEPLRLIVRVTDDHHRYQPKDRFNRPFLLTAGKHTVRIPLADIEAAPAERKTDMTAIALLGVLSIDTRQDGRQFRVSGIRLE